MTEAQVIELMKSSKNEKEWNQNCNTVKTAFDNEYPPFWYAKVIQSAWIKKVLGRFGCSTEITIS